MADNAVASTSKDGAFAEPAAPTKKPRPKPKKKLPTGSIDGVPSAPPSDFAPAATTVPKTAITTAPSELIPEFLLPEIPLTIADRAKSRARNAKAKPIVQDIIDIPSDEDEQLLRLSPHRPKQKVVRGAKSRPVPILPPPLSHPSQESPVTPTSDFQPAPAVSSQLPPSDPPSSTLPLPISTPESAKKRRQVPDADNVDEPPPNPSEKRNHQRVAERVVAEQRDSGGFVQPVEGGTEEAEERYEDELRGLVFLFLFSLLSSDCILCLCGRATLYYLSPVRVVREILRESRIQIWPEGKYRT